MLKIYLIETDKGCFINDCDSKKGFDYEFHSSSIPGLYFDRKKARPSYARNWYIIDEYPEVIERKEPDKKVNRRYKLRNPDMESKALPLVTPRFEIDNFSDIYELLSYDIEEGKFIEAEDVVIDKILEVENFEFPTKIDYEGIEKRTYNDAKIKITNEDLEHRLLDQLVVPDVMLHRYPCKISSDNLYKIIRQYIIKNIDNRYARITSNFDFCFAVTKRIQIRRPAQIEHPEQLIPNYKSYALEEFTVFEMTPSSEKYRGYTVLPDMTANSERELKEKLDKYLEDLIDEINRPYKQCPQCGGTGLIK